MSGKAQTGQVPIKIPDVRLGDFHDRSLSRGQKLSRRASEERGYKTLSDSSPRVLASQPWFLLQIEPDFHLLSQTHVGGASLVSLNQRPLSSAFVHQALLLRPIHSNCSGPLCF